MPRRRFTVAVLLTLFTLSASAAEAERARDSVLPVEQRLELRALFDRAPGVLADDENGLTVGAFAVEVVVAHIVDGKLVKACVDSEEAARRFFEAPATKKQTRVALDR